MISFMPDPAELQLQGLPTSANDRYTNVAYVFQVNGDYVANPQEVTSHFWKASNKYAYHAKIEVTPMIQVNALDARGDQAHRTIPMACTPQEAKQIVSDFLQAAVAEVEVCLPDPAILQGNDNPNDAGNKR
jgi:hypothetical protein